MKDVSEEAVRLIKEYKEKYLSLMETYTTRLKALCVPYAQSIARFGAGETIKSGKRTIRVEKIGAKIVKGKVIPCYFGPVQGGNGEYDEIVENEKIKKL